MKIQGGAVASPTPKSDWNQTDPTRADYIKNKPDPLVASDPNNDGHVVLGGGLSGGGGGSGGTGEDGGYYIPYVSDSGFLSWTPSKSSMPGVSGTNIVNLVLAALPMAEGGSY
jgi:hypothetical protein